MAHVKVANPNNGWLGTEYHIDEKKIEGVKLVDFHVGVAELPVFTFEMNGIPDINMFGDVCFEFTPKTVQEAAEVICHECSDKHSDTYRAFVESVASALKEVPAGTGLYDVAECIVNRIIGLEEK